MTLGCLRQFDQIHCDSRRHKVLSNNILIFGYMFGIDCVWSIQVHFFKLIATHLQFYTSPILSQPRVSPQFVQKLSKPKPKHDNTFILHESDFIRPKLHRCPSRRSVDYFLIDRSIGHGRYRRSIRIHLLENSVDIDGR